LLEKTILVDKLGIDEIQISGCLKGGVPKFQERFVRLRESTFLHKPTRRLWTKPDTEKEWDSGYKGRAKLEPPSNAATVHEHKIGASAEEDAKGRPNLPGHDESSPDRFGSDFSRVDRDCNFFQAHSEPQEYTAGDELTPFLA
jgi:hypothetical protein